MSKRPLVTRLGLVGASLGMLSLLARPGLGQGPNANIMAGAKRPSSTQGWISLGAGNSNFVLGSGVGARASGALSVNRFLGMVRGSAATTGSGCFFGDGDCATASELSALFGLRTTGSKFFATGAVGVSGVWSATRGLDESGPNCKNDSCNGRSDAGVAYDFGLHAGKYIGVAMHLSGTLGSAQSRFTILTMSLEVGSFGR